jgi:hypothetical protein
VSGVNRQRSYENGKNVGEALEQLSNVRGGFGLSVLPAPQVTSNHWFLSHRQVPPNCDALLLWYGWQGSTRTDMVLEYGSNVSQVSRTVNSNDFANWYRVLGVPPNYGEEWTGDAKYTLPPRGLWMGQANHSDVLRQQTLTEYAQGYLDRSSRLAPAYSIQLRGGSYIFGYPRMGDIVRLIIKKNRLAVDDTVRILGITYAVGDDGDENVNLDVGFHGDPITRTTTLPSDEGSPPDDIIDRIEEVQTDVDALARRTGSGSLVARAHRFTAWNTANDSRVGYDMVDPSTMQGWGSGLNIGLFTVPVAGQYLVIATLGFIALTTDVAMGAIVRNGENAAYSGAGSVGTGNTIASCIAVTTLDCAEGDVLEFRQRAMPTGRTGITGTATYMCVVML